MRTTVHTFTCDICNHSIQSASPGLPALWAECNLKITVGLLCNWTFSACGSCMGTETTRSGYPICYDSENLFKRAMRKLFSVYKKVP